MGLFSRKRAEEEETDAKREEYYQKIVRRERNNHTDEWSEKEESPGKDFFFCGLCGWVHISRFPHCH